MSEDSSDSNPEVAAEAELPRFMQATERYRQALAGIVAETEGTAEEQAIKMHEVMLASDPLVRLGQTIDFALSVPNLAASGLPARAAQEMAVELAREDSVIPAEIKAIYTDLYRDELRQSVPDPTAPSVDNQ